MAAAKKQEYLKYAVLFFLVVAVVFGLQWIPWLRPLQRYMLREWGWNWTWPFSLFASCLLGTFLLRVETEGDRDKKMIWSGILFVLGYNALRMNFGPHLGKFPAPNAVAFQFFVGFLEEFLFRRIGFEGLRRIEERFYKHPALKRFGPISILYSSLLYGLMLGSISMMSGSGSFNQGYYIRGFSESVFYCFLYNMSRSIWVPGFAHFVTNLLRVW